MTPTSWARVECSLWRFYDGVRGCPTIAKALYLLVDDVWPEPGQPLNDVRDDLLGLTVMWQGGDQMGDDRRELFLSDPMREMRRTQTGGRDRLRASAAQEIVQKLDVVAPQYCHVQTGKRGREGGIREQTVMKCFDGRGNTLFAAE